LRTKRRNRAIVVQDYGTVYSYSQASGCQILREIILPGRIV
jgi:hypothetical protein